jgi:hypothetical protein
LTPFASAPSRPAHEVGFFSWTGGPDVATGTGRLTAATTTDIQHLDFARLTFGEFGFCVTAVTEPLVENDEWRPTLIASPKSGRRNTPSLTWRWAPLDNRATERSCSSCR